MVHLNPIRQVVASYTSGFRRSTTSWAWIDPEGKVHIIQHGLMHGEWAELYLAKKGITRKDWTKDDEYSGPTHYMVNEEGWVAATNQAAYYIPKRPTTKQLEVIADILEQMVVDGYLTPSGGALYDGLWIESQTSSTDYDSVHMSVEDFMRKYLGRKRVEQMYERLL